MAKKFPAATVATPEPKRGRGRPPANPKAPKVDKPSEYQPFYDAFSTKLKELMEERRESQNSLAQTIAEETNCKGSMQSVVWRWFHAKGMPKWEDAYALKRIFGVTFDYLFDPEVTERHRLTDEERNLLSLARKVGFEIAEARILMVGLPAETKSAPEVTLLPRSGAKRKTSKSG